MKAYLKIHKVSKYIFSNSFQNTLRKIYYVLRREIIQPLTNKLSSFIKFGHSSSNISNSVKIVGYSDNISICKSSKLLEGVVVEISNNGTLIIESNCILSYSVVISCSSRISIGNHTIIGEFTSIRDSSHDYTDKGNPIIYNTDICKPITIGANVWIGRNCLISPGSTINDNVVIGANSIVKGVINSGYIYAGTPLRVIKKIPDISDIK